MKSWLGLVVQYTIVHGTRCHIAKIRQEIDHRSRDSRHLDQGQRSYSRTGCDVFKTRCESIGQLKQTYECFDTCPESGLDPEFGSRARIMLSSEIYWGRPCPTLHRWQNFYEDPVSFFRDISKIVEKCPIWQCWKIRQKVLDSDPEANDFQSSISSLCGRCLHVHKVW